jgi:RNA polymerase-binding protein DksA
MAERAQATRKAAAKKSTATGSPATAGSGRSPADISMKTSTDQAGTTTAGPAVEGATMAKTAEPKTAGKTAAGKERAARSVADTEEIRAALAARLAELKTEHEQTMVEIAELQRDRLTDSAGDDQADTGTKTFEREQEISLANNIAERISQVERALERLDEGGYGWCERCGNPIPVERLAAFPSATLCVSCKQLEERR